MAEVERYYPTPEAQGPPAEAPSPPSTQNPPPVVEASESAIPPDKAPVNFDDLMSFVETASPVDSEKQDLWTYLREMTKGALAEIMNYMKLSFLVADMVEKHFKARGRRVNPFALEVLIDVKLLPLLMTGGLFPIENINQLGQQISGEIIGIILKNFDRFTRPIKRKNVRMQRDKNRVRGLFQALFPEEVLNQV